MKFNAKDKFDEISTLETNKKIEFSEHLLSAMVIMNRGIWSDDTLSDREKIECLKWSNELAHQIWNRIFELRRGEDNNAIGSIWDNILFYRGQSAQLGGHLGATIKMTFDQFE